VGEGLCGDGHSCPSGERSSPLCRKLRSSRGKQPSFARHGRARVPVPTQPCRIHTNSFAAIAYTRPRPQTRAQSGTQLLIGSFNGILPGLFLRAYRFHVESISYNTGSSAGRNSLRIRDFAFAQRSSCISPRYKRTAGHFPAVLVQLCSWMTFGFPTPTVVAPARFQASWRWF
jgi:hypothetical protein